MDARTDLASYLTSRYVELRRRISSLKSDLAYLENELSDVETAAIATNVDLGDADKELKAATGQLNAHLSPVTLKASGSTKTIKDVAVAILENAEGGLTANEILEIMYHDHGMNYPRSSLSPQLSRLKYDGIVGRRNGRWVLSKYLSEKTSTDNETPKGASEAEKPAFPRRNLF